MSASVPVRITPTEEVVLKTSSSVSGHACIFEDDGTTGYLYALKSAENGDAIGPIADAVLVYKYTKGNPRQQSAELQFQWTDSGRCCGLVLDGHLYALFDFDTQIGFNISGFPPASKTDGWARSKEMADAYRLLSVAEEE